ncbi:MAG: hypothetical protein ACJ72Z_08190 [Pyrinomonadaceae bacterium]
MGDEDKAVLAGRLLSYLKRKFGHGPQPSAEETKAAIVAVTLLSTAFPTESKDPITLFEKLIQVSRKGQTAINVSQQSEIDQMRLQMNMQYESKIYTMLSNIMKTKHDTVKNSISNIR